MKSNPKLSQTERLLKVVHELRTQCPWDRKQTHRTLIPYLLEEAYETVDAIHSRDAKHLKEELGDVLLQVALHSELAQENGEFGFEEVAGGIADKMIRRHPHIYEKARVGNKKSHSRNWTRMKTQEKPNRTLLEGTPKAMPGLQLAQRYGEIASSVGFDWVNAKQVYSKVREEIRELDQEWERRSKAGMEEELGDLLFTLANLARHLKIDAERSLKNSAMKFAERFTEVENEMKRRGKPLTECSARELDAAWNDVKNKFKKKVRAKKPR